MARRALLIGINTYYDAHADLRGCVSDAQHLAQQLRPQGFPSAHDWRVTLVTDQPRSVLDDFDPGVSGEVLRRSIREHFDCVKDDELLFYFAGHAELAIDGAELVGSDGQGYSFASLMNLVNDCSPASKITIILDCCASGQLANERPSSTRWSDPFRMQHAVLREGVSLLTASRNDDKATEATSREPVGGEFTTLIRLGLAGQAADLFGKVTALNLYEFVASHMALSRQKPMFKAHVSEPTELLRTEPRVDVHRLMQLPELFPTPEAGFSVTMLHEGGPTNDPRPESGTLARTLDYIPFSGSAEQRELDLLKEWRDAGITQAASGDFYHMCEKNGQVLLTDLGQYMWRRIKDATEP